MKKLFAAVSAVLLVWNIWLTYRITNTPVAGGSEVRKTIVHNTVSGFSTDITKVIENVKSTVVRVEPSSGMTASGVVVETDETDVFILTSLEVQPEKKVNVVFDNDISVKAECEGYDEKTSLALLRCRPGFTVKAIEISDITLRTCGEYGIGVGSKRRTGSAAVTFGIVNGGIHMKRNYAEAGTVKMVETDLSVNQDTVGGALVNLNGELMGIFVNQPATGNADMGYAVNSDEMMYIFEDLKENGIVTRGVLDVETKGIDEMSSYEKNAYGISLDRDSGVRVMRSDNTQEEGIMSGDIILSVDDEEINNEQDLLACMYRNTAGSEVQIRVLREEEVLLSVVLK